MKMRAVALLAGLLLLSARAWSAPWKIQGGVGIGPAVLGADLKAIDPNLSKFFNIEEKIDDGGILKWIKYKEGLELHIDHGKILQVIVHSATMISKQGPLELEAEGGIKVGSTVLQMEQMYGRGYTSENLKVAKSQPAETYYAYVSKGLGLIASQGRIIQIAVWPRK